jgi:hypothetical protein
MNFANRLATIMDAVVREQGLASVDKPMSDELWRFINAVQERAGKVREDKPDRAPVEDSEV